MSFMEMQIFKKGATYCAECVKCGSVMFSHEWAHVDNNERRDALQAGTLQCEECCTGTVSADTFQTLKPQYAGWYSAPGYMDCTRLEFDTNRRRLERTLRDLYGDND